MRGMNTVNQKTKNKALRRPETHVDAKASTEDRN